jgi:hypothetical protein
MLSLILYGRNDDHGYNYHKRLAISLNCLAEVLTNPTDEMVFVDYNTPNELPTILEAIQDTLTPKAKSLLRLFRVRPSHHQQFTEKTPLPVLEPLARNIAIRRTNPNNKWILSTNIDMIFVPEKADSLSDIVATLKDGFYSLPRFELPENFWELSLERLDPIGTISLLRTYSQQLHLDTVILKEDFIKYDNPGDFQLMLRKDILEIGGFDERMIHGWHVDSNLSKRMSLWGKSGDSIEKLVKGYHCNHTHKLSFSHSQNRTQNNWHQFVSSSTLTPVVTQPNWGLAHEKLEEISLKAPPSRTHLNALLSSLKERQPSENPFVVTPDTYNHLLYSPSRIFVYLADHLCHLPSNTNIVYCGHNPDLINKLNTYLASKNFQGKLFCCTELLDPKDVSLYIFDFGFDEHSEIGQAIANDAKRYALEREKMKPVIDAFLAVVRTTKNEAKFIGINVNYTDFGLIFDRHLSIRLTSYVTGISYGYLPAPKRPFRISKKKTLSFLRYLVARYLFDHSDAIRRFALKHLV